MANDLVKMQNEFSGLDMGALIGGPLTAVCDAQTMLAKSTVDFIEKVGLAAPDGNSPPKVRTTKFSFDRAAEGTGGQGTGTERMAMEVPLLSIVKIPTFAVDHASISFDMEVKSSTAAETSSDKKGELDAEAGFKYGPFHMDVKVKGSIACHESNTRTSDNSAKYHVDVYARDFGMPEGLARMLDILAQSAAPVPAAEPGRNPAGPTAP